MDNSIRVIERLFNILDLLAQAQQPLSLTDLVHETGMSKTTVYRLLQNMYEFGYVQKNRDCMYSIGPKIMELASYHISNLELQTEAKPFLSDLHSELNLSVHMGALEGDRIIYLEKISSSRSKHNDSKTGIKVPAYCSSIGKCLMSCLSGDELEDIMYSCKFQKFTTNTIVNIYDLKKHLKEVRKQGWAMDNCEYLPDRRCVGAPIFDYLGTAVAAVSVSGNLHEISDEKLPSIIYEVKETARQISLSMGYMI